MIVILESDGRFHEDITDMFNSTQQAREAYGDSLVGLRLLECDIVPDDPHNHMWVNGSWEPIEILGMAYDEVDHSYYNHDSYRIILHQRTVDDVLEAQRKIRAGDTSIDWQAWLDALDAYNKAVSDTKFQDTYPDTVTYPKYPTKPTPQP